MTKAGGKSQAAIQSFDGRNFLLEFPAARPAASKRSRAQKRVRSLNVILDGVLCYALKMPQSIASLNVPLPSAKLPALLDLIDRDAGVSILTEPLGLEAFYKARLSSIRGRALQLEVEILSNLNFSKLPVELKLGYDQTLAAGEVLKIKPTEVGFLYRGLLTLVQLLRFGPPQTARLSISDLETNASLDISAPDVGTIGYVDMATGSAVAGWVGSFNDAGPYKVNLRQGNRIVATTIADGPRLDVLAFGLSTSRCGFTFETSTISSIEVGSSLSVTIGDLKPIHVLNSPFVIAD
jgi:hypothetical protein